MRGLVFLLPVVAASAPQVNYPLNLQFPPVAQLGQPYTYQFASTTFQPDPNSLQYSLVGNPSWLGLHGDNRTLWGTPKIGDTGNVTFTIAAAGEAGAVTNMESRLVVTDVPAPQISGNISAPLARAGQLAGPTTLLLLPSRPFSIEFGQDTFVHSGPPLKCESTLADHTPLPSWISFDANSLRLAGTTPPLSSATQFYNISLLATDDSGFSVASISFNLIISQHQLAFKPLQQTINVTKGQHVDISGLRGDLFLDGNSASDRDIQSVSAEIPSWLSFDNHTFQISGTPPPTLMSQDLAVTVVDTYGDTAKQDIRITFQSALFTAQLDSLNITIGKHFDWLIPRSALVSGDETVSVDFGILKKWLEFDAASLTISGMIPQGATPQDVEISLTAMDADEKTQDTQTFMAHILEADGTSTNGGSLSQGNSQTKDDSMGATERDSRSKRAGTIAGAVVGAIIAVLILLVFALLLCRKRKGTKSCASPKVPRSPRKTDISRPIMIQDEWEEAFAKTTEQDLEKGDSDSNGDEGYLVKKTGSPPKLNISLPGQRKHSHSRQSSIDECDSRLLDHPDTSPIGFLDEAGPSHHPHDAMKIPTVMARSESGRSNPLEELRRQTTAVDSDHAISAEQHGAQQDMGPKRGHFTFSPLGSNSNLSEYRRRLSSDAHSAKTSILYSQPSTALNSPKLKHATNKRPSIRMVSHSYHSSRNSASELSRGRHRHPGRRDNRDSLIDRRTLDEKRKSYIRKRASAQSPFFCPGSERVCSATYNSPPAFISSMGRTRSKSPDSGDVVLPDDSIVECGSNDDPGVPERASDLRTAFPGSLRKHPKTTRPWEKRAKPVDSIMDRSRGYERCKFPEAVHVAQADDSGLSSTLRAHELKAGLNEHLESKVFADAELSESMYSTEEEDIEEYGKRTTVTAGLYSIRPLNVNQTWLEKPKQGRNSKRDSKRRSRTEEQLHKRRLSQRDSTPYSLAIEHGGKENHASYYNFSLLSSADRATPMPSIPSKSPGRPQTIATTSIRTRTPPRHSRATSSIATETKTTRDSTRSKRASQDSGNRARHSRMKSKSEAVHARTQSRQSRQSTSNTKRTRGHSRTQSGAYPHFDVTKLPATLIDPRSHKEPATRQESRLPHADTDASLFSRDLSGNVTHYGINEEPSIEELGPSAIGLGASNGIINSSARQSRLLMHMSQQDKPVGKNRESSARRDTTFRATAPSPTYHAYSIGGAGLRLDGLHGSNAADAVSSGAEGWGEGGDKARTPLSLLDGGNGASHVDRLRVMEGKGRRPGSGEVGEELRVGASRKGRTTWGHGWRRVVSGRGTGPRSRTSAVDARGGGNAKGKGKGKGKAEGEGEGEGVSEVGSAGTWEDGESKAFL